MEARLKEALAEHKYAATHQSSRLSWARLKAISIHTGRVSVPGYYPADPEYAGRLWRGVRDPPPPGHIWVRDACQAYLDLAGCRKLSVPAFHCRRKTPNVSQPKYSIQSNRVSLSALPAPPPTQLYSMVAR